MLTSTTVPPSSTISPTLSGAARPYIEASVPALREHGLEITRRFYSEMFRAHPELQHLFNMGNQANGSQQQSLAATVFAYAANIDSAPILAPVIERIVHKHASVGIRPAHYPIVGRYLLAAIQNVLGVAATPALMAAWDEAYWLLAGELIAAEARLYQNIGTTAGALLTVEVMEVREESDDVISYYLQTPEHRSPGNFQPGQYISVAVNLGTLCQRRQYSLSDAPHHPWWRITVKREGTDSTPAGQVSNWLHTNLKRGDTLQVSPAFGDFVPKLEGMTPITLLSAGVGITPMVSVLNALLKTNPTRPLWFIYAARNGHHHPLRADLKAARDNHPNLREVIFYDMPLATDRQGIDYHAAGLADLSSVLKTPALTGDFFLCGPIGFMQAQWQALLAAQVSPTRIHREVFGPELLDHLL